MAETASGRSAAGIEIPERIVFLAGAPRCGTTAMSKYLAAHPACCFSRPKETHFLLGASARTPTAVLRDRYLKAHFTHLEPGHEILGDGSVSYLYAPEALERALEMFPAARFLILLRNPPELVYSYHQRLVFMTEEPVTDFEQAWALREARRGGRNVPRRCRDPRMLQYDEIGRLGMQLERLFRITGRDRCFVALHDDLVSDPLATYRSVLDFLGLEYDGRTEFPRRNKHNAFKSPFLQQLLFGKLGVTLTPLLKAYQRQDLPFPREAIRNLRRRIRKRNTVKVKPAPLPDRLREELAAEFSDDVRYLEELLGRDLSHWRDQSSPVAHPG